MSLSQDVVAALGYSSFDHSQSSALTAVRDLLTKFSEYETSLGPEFSAGFVNVVNNINFQEHSEEFFRILEKNGTNRFLRHLIKLLYVTPLPSASFASAAAAAANNNNHGNVLDLSFFLYGLQFLEKLFRHTPSANPEKGLLDRVTVDGVIQLVWKLLTNSIEGDEIFLQSLLCFDAIVSCPYHLDSKHNTKRELLIGQLTKVRDRCESVPSCVALLDPLLAKLKHLEALQQAAANTANSVNTTITTNDGASIESSSSLSSSSSSLSSSSSAPSSVAEASSKEIKESSASTSIASTDLESTALTETLARIERETTLVPSTSTPLLSSLSSTAAATATTTEAQQEALLPHSQAQSDQSFQHAEAQDVQGTSHNKNNNHNNGTTDNNNNNNHTQPDGQIDSNNIEEKVISNNFQQLHAEACTSLASALDTSQPDNNPIVNEQIIGEEQVSGTKENEGENGETTSTSSSVGEDGSLTLHLHSDTSVTTSSSTSTATVATSATATIPFVPAERIEDPQVEGEETWAYVQRKTFTRWVNRRLNLRAMKIKNLYEACSDGVMLCNLIEICEGGVGSSLSIGKWIEKPKSIFQKLRNVNVCLDFLILKKNMKLVNIGASDIIEKNQTIILGLVWLLILHYSHLDLDNNSNGTPRQVLLEWVNQAVVMYRERFQIPTINNFTTSFMDGRVLSALCDSLQPGLINVPHSDPLTATTIAMNLAEQHFELPQFLDAYDVVNHPDENAMMCYVNLFREISESRTREISIEKCVVEGEGIEKGFKNQQLRFLVITRSEDEKLTFCSEKKQPLKIQIFDPNNKQIKVNVEWNVFCGYECMYVADEEGEYRIRISIGGQIVRAPPREIGEEKQGSNTLAQENQQERYVDDSNEETTTTGLDEKESVSPSFSAADEKHYLEDSGKHVNARETGPENITTDFICCVRNNAREIIPPPSEGVMCVVYDKYKNYRSYITLTGDCVNKYGEMMAHLVEQDGLEVYSPADPPVFWGNVESDCVYDNYERKIGGIQMDKGWIRDDGGSTVCELTRIGEASGRFGTFLGQFEGFTYHRMQYVALYLLVVDSDMLVEEAEEF